jgi:hypothetical protein
MEFLDQLLKAVLAAAIPVLLGFVKQYMDKLAETAKKRLENERLESAMGELTSAAASAVAQVNQNWVDALKKEDKFTSADAQKALKEALGIAVSTMTPAAKRALGDAMDGWTELLKAKIEEFVREDKYRQWTIASSAAPF